MDRVGEAVLIPRDDRSWPRWAAPFSALAVLAALVTFVLVLASGSMRLVVAVAFVAVAVVEVIAYVGAMRRLLEGHRVPAWSHVVRLVAALAGLVTMSAVDAQVGLAMLAGLFVGMFAANLWAMRAARANRGRVDEALTARAREREEARDTAVPEAGPAETRRADDVPAVGPVLRQTLTVDVQRLGAWLVAGAITLAGCLLLSAPEAAWFGVAFMGAAACLWVARRTVGAWLALRDFRRAASPPRRAYAVLLHDPTPRMIRPLLGIWAEEPVSGPGRLPTPDRVYRCDDERDALRCWQGEVVVHEAWVDTGKRESSKPRWVAADAGVALPHRRALFGRWFMSSLIGAERPESARALTVPAPSPSAETTNQEVPDVGSFPVKVAWRLAGLIAVALLFAFAA